MDRKTLPVIIVGLIIAVVAGLVVFAQGDEAEPTSTPTVDDCATVLAGNATVAAAPGLIAPQDYQSQFVDGNAGHFLVDVRTPQEFADGHLPCAVNIPLQDLQAGRGFDAIPDDVPVVLYCRSGNRSGVAYDLLEARGYDDLYDIANGIIAWNAQGLPIE